MSSYSREQLENWIRDIKIVQGKVLDIGGSQLPILKRLKNTSLFVEEYKILDLEHPHECKEEPDIICDLNIPLDLREFEQYIDYFDVAFCIEVSEYWYNPFEALDNIFYLLRKGGILYLSTHFIYPVHNPIKQDYIRYTPEGIKKLLEETGFEILEMTPRLLRTNISNIDGMRPAKDYDKHNWQGCMIKAKKL